MKQYRELCKRILNKGVMVHNERTNKGVLTVINADLEYNVGAGEFPLVTTRKAYYKPAIAELLGYLRGHDNASAFRDLGTQTWNANANDNPAWLKNPARYGEDDMGRVYGVQLREWRSSSRTEYDQLTKVYNNLKQGIDDRGEILMMWNPGEFDLGCLRPCMYGYQFSILDGTLHLHATQRSCDVPLGLVFNMVQVYAFLAIMAQITGLKPGIAYHKIVNAHIYEDQIDLMKMQVTRTPHASPKFKINSDIKTLDDVLTWVNVEEDFELSGYTHYPAIKYPFSV